MAGRLARLVTGRPMVVVLIAAALTIVFASRIVDPRTGDVGIRIDPSFDAILPDTAPPRVFYDWTNEEFGNDRSLILSLTLDDVFTVENLERIARISDRLEEAEGVDYVTSLATADHIGTVDGSVETRPFLDPLPTTGDEAERVRRAVHGNPVYAGNLVSPDSTATAFIVHVDDTPEQAFTDARLDQRMYELVVEESGGGDVHMSGTAHMRAATSLVLRSDLMFMLPSVVLLMAIIAWASFRSPRGVAIPLLTILLATVWTLGLMAWLDIPINMITTIVPVLLLTIGFAYSVHVVADYYAAFETSEEEVASAGGPAVWALGHVALPVALTCITTVAGFLSLMISDFPAVREFGIVSVFGVTATTLLTLTLAPALLELLGPPTAKSLDRRQEGGATSGIERAVVALGRYSIDNRRTLLLAGASIAVVTLWGIGRIEIDTHLITNFSEENPVRVHFYEINEKLEGARPFSVVLRTDEEESFLQPENLEALDALTAWLAEQPEVGGATSFASYVKLINRAFHDDDPSYLTIPDDPTLIKQYLLFTETEDLEDYVASNYQNALIKVRSKCETTQEIARLAERIEARLAELPPALSAQATVTGNTVVLAKSIDAIANGQIESLSLAAVFIFAILALLFSSARMGFFGLVPNILPVLLFFGLLGLTGLPLNATTGLIACVVLGIAVDDTIHFMTRFNREARDLADEKLGALAAVSELARPVTITTFCLCLGFLVFTTGELRNQIEFGFLAAIVLAFAWAVDVTFTPALTSGLRIVTLWDALTYDLGEEPEKRIPAFDGLSRTQSRIAALMTRIVERPAGERLFSIGDEGDCLYVVIDGELGVTIPGRSGVPRRLSSATRGDLVGEVGLYHGKRTADVEALTDVRLMRLDAENLERLRRRYPRIGGKLLWNLSRIMAGRLALATDRETELAIRLEDLGGAADRTS